MHFILIKPVFSDYLPYVPALCNPQGLKNPLVRCPELVISTFGSAEIISCMPDRLVNKYIGYEQPCQYSSIYLYSGCLLPSVDGLVKKICIGCHPTRQWPRFLVSVRYLHSLVSLSLNKCVMYVWAILLVSECIKITFILTLIINR